MEIEPIGAVTVLAGLLALWCGPAVGIYVLALSTLLGAAAAVKLPAMGGASIMPSHVILGFFALSILMRPTLRSRALLSLAPTSAGFWLLSFVLYGVVTATFFPRLFAGATEVFSIARSEGVKHEIIISPLGPSAANVTQSVYLIADLLCFAAVAAYASSAAPRELAKIILTLATVSLGFVVLDYATFLTGTADALSFIRNANYRMLNDGVVHGFKRVVGSFTEASYYSYVTLGYFGFALKLWLDGVWPRISAPLAGVLGLTLLLSTSSTAYAAFALFLAATYVGCARRMSGGRASKQATLFVVAVPPVAATVLLGLPLIPAVWDTLTPLFDYVVVNKLQSQSGVERGEWNAYALRAFLDTSGVGAGVGSVRASSLALAALSATGVVGFTLYVLFLFKLVRRPDRDAERSGRTIVTLAAAAACFAMLCASVISGGSVDLGLPFFLLAGIACAGDCLRRVASRERAAVHGRPAFATRRIAIEGRPS